MKQQYETNTGRIRKNKSSKSQLAHQRMNVADPNIYMSSFKEVMWKGFAIEQKSKQIVHKLHEQLEKLACLKVNI